MNIEIFKYNPTIVDNTDNKQTLSIYLASNGVIPPKIFEHQKDIRDSNGKTVQDYLIENSIDVPDQWQIQQFNQQTEKLLRQYCERYNTDKYEILQNPQWQNNIDQQTFAQFLAFNSVIPHKQFEHDSKLQNKWGYTVAVYLEINSIQVPQQWLYDPLYKLKYNNTTAMMIADNGKIPSQYWNHNPKVQNDIQYTVAIYLSRRGIIPPKQWQHDPYLENNLENTVQDYLKQNNIEVSKEWKIQKFNKITKQYLKEYCKEYNVDKQVIINNQEWQNNKDNITFAMYLAQKCIIPPKQFIHEPNIKGGYDNKTIRQYLEDNYLPIPNECYDDEYKQKHDYNSEYVNNAMYGIMIDKFINVKSETQYKDGWTIAIIYASQGIIPTKQWDHTPNLYNDYGFTVEDYLVQSNIEVPDNWKTQQFSNEVQKYLIKYCKDYNMNKQKIINNIKYFENKYNYPFAVYLELNDIQTPKEFQYSPLYKLNNKMTTAMIIAKKGKIPSECWNHDPLLMDDNDNTVSYYLEINKIETPIQWRYDPIYILKYEITMAMLLTQNGIIPSQCWNHNPYIADKDDNTVAMILAKQGIIPPKQWEHYAEIQNSDKYTVSMYLAQNKILDIPKQWQHDPQLQNNKRQTVSMIYAQISQIPPKEWLHDPLFKDEDGDTVALNLAYYNVIPPKEWEHDKDIKNKYGFTVQDYLQSNNIAIPEQWKTTDCGVQDKKIIKQLSNYCRKYNIDKDIIINNPSWQDNEDKETFAMYLAQNKIISPKQFIHDPKIYNKNGDTVAVFLDINEIQIPEEWRYNPFYKLQNNSTTAMKIAYQGKIPSQQWQHSPILQDDNGNTVAIILAQKEIVPPNQWIYDIDIKNKKGESIESNLYKYNYIYINNQFTKLTQDIINKYIKIKRDYNTNCHKCHNNNYEFVQYICNHKICLKCFEEIINKSNYYQCPICEKECSFVLNNQNK